MPHSNKQPPKSKNSSTMPDTSQQIRATTAAKLARINEAGLGAKRTGKASATTKRAQGRRDLKADDSEALIDDKLAVLAEAQSEPASNDEAPDTEDQPSLQVQVNTDHNVHGSERLELYVRSTVEASLGRFGERLTRVEVHLSDDNGQRSRGDDKRCLMEARPAGMQPIVVTHLASTIDDAVDGAVMKLEKLLDNTFHKQHDHKGRQSLGHNMVQ